MVDPISLAATAAGGKALDSAAAETGGLLKRVLGPAADELGEALARYTQFRTRNVGRIVDVADRRSNAGASSGSVPPRVAQKLLDDGSYCDDDVMVDYLGGVLAAGRTPTGRDDRAVTWSSLVTSMSALQLHTHYLLYTEWAAKLAEHPGIDFDADAGGGFTLVIDADELANRLRELLPEAEPGQLLIHAITGLTRLGLIDEFGTTWGSKAYVYENHLALRDVPFVERPAAQAVPFKHCVAVSMSEPGIELWGWGHGINDLSFSSWGAGTAERGLLDEPITPRLVGVAFPVFGRVPMRADEDEPDNS